MTVWSRPDRTIIICRFIYRHRFSHTKRVAARMEARTSGTVASDKTFVPCRLERCAPRPPPPPLPRAPRRQRRHRHAPPSPAAQPADGRSVVRPLSVLSFVVRSSRTNSCRRAASYFILPANSVVTQRRVPYNDKTGRRVSRQRSMWRRLRAFLA